MRRGRALPRLGAAAIAAACSLGCSGESASRPPPLSPRLQPGPGSLDQSPVCKSFGNRFVGLPAASAPGTPTADVMLGSWWIRGCSVRRSGDRLEIHLQGPGWYWVQEAASGIAVEQQVPFELSLQLEGRLRDRSAEGVMSLWFEPASKPRVQVVAPARLEVRSLNALGVLVRLVPLSSPETRAAQRFSAGMTAALERRLGEGATVTYDLESGQTDAALGQLDAGRLPRHPFEDGKAWIVNDRYLLSQGATQVVGPIPAGTSHVDVAIERGAGLAYRALCSERMSEHYAAIAAGQLARVPSDAWAAAGQVGGAGRQTSELRVPGCPFYLVIASGGGASTLVALRVRQ